MLVDVARAYFSSYSAIAQALGIKVQAVSQWKKRGLVPELRARQLHELTRGELKFEPEAYARERTSIED